MYLEKFLKKIPESENKR